MNTKYRIKKNDEFDDILNNGRKTNNSYFSLYNKDNNLTYARFGITLSKKFGNAVERNKYKRIIREIIRTNMFLFKNNCDYIIIIRKKCDDSNYKIMKENLINLIK